MREHLLSADISVNSVEWDEFEENGLLSVKNKIIEKTPAGFECNAKLCSLNESCIITLAEEKDIYAENAFISADLHTYAPRQLKIFCWQK